MTPEEVADRLEIQDLLTRYSEAVDRRRWDALDELFSPDATIDYSAMGGATGDLATIKAFLAEAMDNFATTQHMVGLPAIEIEGDRATVSVPCHNPMVLKGEEGRLLLCGLWYHEQLVRTPAGWRIQVLREERAYMKFFNQ